jgi:pSer/pThr/pTyr-binding forkhead associated (FHA) protein
VVNGNVVTEKILATGDEILIGKFTLVFYGDSLSLSEQLLSGVSVGELPTYQVQQIDVNDSTFTLSPSQVKRMREMIRRQRAAVVISQEDPEQIWKPGDQVLNFGKKQAVPVGGWLAGGIAATLEWVGSGHVLKKAGLAKLTVKGKVISERMLEDGDEFAIGPSKFIYRFED